MPTSKKKAPARQNRSKVAELQGFVNLRQICEEFRPEKEQHASTVFGLSYQRVMAVSKVRAAFQRPYGRGYHYFLSEEDAGKVRSTLTERQKRYQATRATLQPINDQAADPTPAEPIIMLPSDRPAAKLFEAINSLMQPVLSELGANRMLLDQQQRILMEQARQLSTQDRIMKSLYAELTGKAAA